MIKEKMYVRKLVLFVFILYLFMLMRVDADTHWDTAPVCVFIGKDELQHNKIRGDTYITDAAGIFIQQLTCDATAQCSVPGVLQRK